MVSLEESHSNSNVLASSRTLYNTSSTSSIKIQRSLGRSMRTIRSNLYQTDRSCSFADKSSCVSENLTDSVIDMRLGELASRSNKSAQSPSQDEEYLDLSHAFSDFSACSSDISGELQRLASLPPSEDVAKNESSDPEPEPCLGTKPCALLNLSLIDDNKISIGACGAIPPLVSLLLNGSNRGKKDALTTLYKLCSMKQNKERAVSAGAVKLLVELDGSVKGKEFAVLTLLLLCADSVRNRGLLVREGGIPPLVALSQTGTARAKHKAETLLGYLREPRQEASTSSP
ncbi:unnamed protein product, partial [Vitis vinifera]